MAGHVRTEWHGDRVNRTVDEALLQGMWLAALHLLGEAQAIVPIEEATLERSGVASVDEAKGQAAVSYDTPYSVIQHERLDFQHDPGRQAKYLETPFVADREVLNGIIAAQIRRSLR